MMYTIVFRDVSCVLLSVDFADFHKKYKVYYNENNTPSCYELVEDRVGNHDG